MMLPSADTIADNPWASQPPSQSALSALRAAKLGATHSVTSKTRSRYATAFDKFAAFCQRNGYSALPASVQAVLAYCGHTMQTGRARSLGAALGAVNHAHISHGFWSPTNHPAVTQTRKGILRWVAEHQPRTVAWRLPLRPEHLRQALDKVDRSEPRVAQALAVLAFGLRIGQRASTLGHLKLQDVRFLREHVDIYIARSKTDQEGRGRHIFVEYPAADSSPLHPITALRHHLKINNITEGYLFRAFSASGRPLRRPLAGRGVNTAVKWLCYDTLGLQGLYSGHSIRIGAATALAEAGAEDHVIRRTCGWTGPYAQTYLRFSRSGQGDLSVAMGLF